MVVESLLEAIHQLGVAGQNYGSGGPVMGEFSEVHLGITLLCEGRRHGTVLISEQVVRHELD